MKIVFMGEKPLADYCLHDLISRGQVPVAICTRKKTDFVWWGEQYIYEIAQKENIPIVQREEIIKIKPDLLISVLYPFIIEEEVLNAASKTYNLHLAPLPEYKGCNTGSHALMNGDDKFGVTLHEMTATLDVGPIVEKEYFPLTKVDTSKTLYEKAVKVGKKVWNRNVENILFGKVIAKKYKDDFSKAYKRNSLDNKQIPLNLNNEEIYNFVRGLDFPPFEPAFFFSKGEKIHLRQKDFNENYEIIDIDKKRKFLIYRQC